MFGLISIIMVVSLVAHGQALKKADLVGTWKVLAVNELSGKFSQDELAAMRSLKKDFLKAKFTFKEDGNFSYDFPIAEMRMKNKHWKIDPSTGNVLVQEWKDKDNDKWLLFEIAPLKDGGKVEFVLVESPIVLVVTKE